MARTLGTLPISANFEVAVASAFDARTIVPLQSDLTNPATFGVYAYKGMIVSVYADPTPANNGIYRLNALPATSFANWISVGGVTATISTSTGNYLIVANAAARLAIPALNRLNGMLVLQEDTFQMWELYNGVADTNWRVVNSMMYPWVTGTPYIAKEIIIDPDTYYLYQVVSNYTSGASVAADVASVNLIQVGAGATKILDWTTATPYVSNQVLVDSITNYIYRVVNNYTSTASLAGDVAAGNLIMIGGSGAAGSGTQIDQSGTPIHYSALIGLVNGLNPTFVVSRGAYTAGKLTVYRNGQLQDESTWTETTPTSGVFTFVTPPLVGDVIMAIYGGGGGGGAGGATQSLEFNVGQIAHGFTPLTPVYYDTTLLKWMAARANNPDTLATHIVSVVINVDSFSVCQAGAITVTGHGKALGYWFTSATVAGATVSSSPALSNPVFLVEDVNTVHVLNYRPIAGVPAGTTIYDWATATFYAIADVIVDPATKFIYRAITNFTSSASIALDVTNLNLEQIGGGGSGSGNMLKATYDPTNINASAFNVDNHIDGVTNKVFTAAEKTKLDGIITTSPLVLRTLYVSVAGNDITGDGTDDNPFATIAHTLSIITPPYDNTHHWVIRLGPGRYLETVDLAFPPYVDLIGDSHRSTYVRVTGGTNSILPTANWGSGGSTWTSFKGIYFGGTTHLNFNLQALGGNNAILILEDCWIAGALNFQGRNAGGGDYIEAYDTFIFGAVTLDQCLAQWQGGVFANTLHIDATLAACSATFINCNFNNNVAVTGTFANTVQFASSPFAAVGITLTVSGLGVLTADSNSVPPLTQQTLTTPIVYMDDSTTLKYTPSTPGNWSAVPSTVQGALDTLSIPTVAVGIASYTAQSNFLTTTTNTSFTSKVTLTTPSLVAGNYVVFVGYTWFYTNVNHAFLAQVLVDSTTVIWSTVDTPANIQITNRYPAQGFGIITLAAGVHVIELDYCTSSNLDTAGIDAASLLMYKI